MGLCCHFKPNWFTLIFGDDNLHYTALFFCRQCVSWVLDSHSRTPNHCLIILTQMGMALWS